MTAASVRWLPEGTGFFMLSSRALTRGMLPVVALLLMTVLLPSSPAAAARKPAAAPSMAIKASGTATNGARMTVKVTVKPAKKKGLVVLQYNSSTGWKKLDTAHQSSHGRAVLVARPKASGTLKVRAVTIASKARRAGHSTTKSVHVFPSRAPQVIAHRGLSKTAPENTLASYSAALKAGAGGVETDIQRTSDGKLVLFHDATLGRTTNVATVFPGRENDPVSTFTLTELKSLDCGSWKDTKWQGTQMATLDELLDLLDGKSVRLIAEIKVTAPNVAAPGIAGQVVEALVHHKMIAPGDGDRVEIASYDTTVLGEVKEISPDADTGVIFDVVPADVADLSWATSLHLPHWQVDAAVMQRARAAGLGVFVWTVNGKADAYRLADLGVTGVTTDVADVMRAALLN